MSRYEKRQSIRHSEPPNGGGKIRYEVERVPPAKNLMGVCLSVSLHGQEGHWNGSTSRPHDLVDCEWCKKGMGWKWQGFFFAWNPNLKIIFAVQVPSGPYGTFLDFQNQHGTLRGSRFVLWRPKKFPTAPVAARLTMPEGAEWMLPACPDMDEFLQRLFYGGWRQNQTSQLPTDPAGEQLQMIDNMPRGVVPVNRLVDQVMSEKKLNGKHKK